MLFNSGQFIIFFPIVVLIYFIVPNRFKNACLLVASYYFYMCWNAKYALLLLFSTLITFIAGLLLEKIKKSQLSAKQINILKKATLIIALTTNLIILFYYKYINFVLSLFGSLANLIHIELNIPFFDLVLPVGISFYTFQALGYLIDVYRDDIYAEKNLIKYALFVSFFPQLVAGPIERSKNLLKQLNSSSKFNVESAREGLLIMLWGYFLKLVIADRCAIPVNLVYGAHNAYKGIQVVFANIMFALQIYCDFMGYSTIAIGAAKVLGIDLMNNFAQPYFATSIKNFWQRWHISLSSWFRDYVYIPLGGNRCPLFMKYRNLFITFMISGLWHGANITFIIWGMLHGIYQIIEDIFKPLTVKCIKMFNIDINLFSWKIIRMLKTFVLVDIAWIFFRADTLPIAWHMLKSSFDISNWGLLLNKGLYQLGLDITNMNILLIGIVFLFISSYMSERGIDVKKWLNKQSIIFRYALYWGAIFLIILSLDIGGQEFVYFQF